MAQVGFLLGAAKALSLLRLGLFIAALIALGSAAGSFGLVISYPLGLGLLVGSGGGIGLRLGLGGLLRLLAFGLGIIGGVP